VQDYIEALNFLSAFRLMRFDTRSIEEVDVALFKDLHKGNLCGPGGRCCRDIFDGLACDLLLTTLGQIANRDDADQTLLATEYQYAADLFFSHVIGDLVSGLVFVAPEDVVRHNIPRLGLLDVFAVCDHAQDDIAVR
jgi:hypothetical protein